MQELIYRISGIFGQNCRTLNYVFLSILPLSHFPPFPRPRRPSKLVQSFEKPVGETILEDFAKRYTQVEKKATDLEKTCDNQLSQLQTIGKLAAFTANSTAQTLRVAYQVVKKMLAAAV